MGPTETIASSSKLAGDANFCLSTHLPFTPSLGWRSRWHRRGHVKENGGTVTVYLAISLLATCVDECLDLGLQCMHSSSALLLRPSHSESGRTGD